MNYGPASKFYDLFGAKQDIEFYRDLALKRGKKALELGVGTARVAIELAKAGVTVWGIDNSKYMLNVAHQKLKQENMSIRNRLILKLGNMMDFKLEERFPFIYVPSAGFEHLTTSEDQKRCLKSVHNAIEKDGILAFDVSQLSSDESESSWWIDRRETSSKDEVVRTIFSKRNQATNIVSVNLFFEVYRDGLLKERYHEYGEALVTPKKELEKTLSTSGFKLESVYGGFDRSPYSVKSKQIVFIARAI